MANRLSPLAILLALAMAMLACGGTAAPTGGGPAAGATLPPDFPEDVPIMEGALGLQLTADNTYIAYEVPGDVEEVKVYYQEALAELGWEQLSRADSGFGDSITLLRSKPATNISVTIQSIPGSPNVRVLITLIEK